ncbi:MAG TPA: polymer-forming cytoskeletal protein, partial [Rhodobiaceae bacterium]|nr:polymer-forming cytoskeletal protein [Rhodobiaceae bacterium]
IVIRGRVVGTIRGRRVQLASTCHVEGDILHEALAVETGAFFEGACRHSDDPISQQSGAGAVR